MTVAITVRLNGQLSLGILVSQIDWTGVHCANTVIASRILRTMMLIFQNHRNALCLLFVVRRL